MSEIPYPLDSGSSGNQNEGPSFEVTRSEKAAVDGLPLQETVQGIAATRPRSMGGEVNAMFITGLVNQIYQELGEAKKELREIKAELKGKIEALSDLKIKAAVLQTRLDVVVKSRHLKNVVIVAGTTTLTLAFELYRNNFGNMTFLIGLVGIVLILLGWFLSGKEAD